MPAVSVNIRDGFPGLGKTFLIFVNLLFQSKLHFPVLRYWIGVSRFIQQMLGLFFNRENADLKLEKKHSQSAKESAHPAKSPPEALPPIRFSLSAGSPCALAAEKAGHDLHR